MNVQPVKHKPDIGVFYLAWGSRTDPLPPLKMFHDSYLRHRSGTDHTLYVLFKGYRNAADLRAAQDLLRDTPHRAIFIDEREWDIGAYFIGARQSGCEFACFLNTYSEILGDDWLLKLVRQLQRPEVGLVGCSGSFEAPQHPRLLDNTPFPNPHLRSNAFAVRRDRFLKLKPKTPLDDKLSTHLFEHGSCSLARTVTSEGLKVLVVGRDGRGYETAEWPQSRTFRQGDQRNLLIGDNRTRDYAVAPMAEKRVLFRMAWGDGSHGHVELQPAEPMDPHMTFVQSVYWILLGRMPNRADVTRWSAALRDGMSNDEFVGRIRDIPEGVIWRSTNPALEMLFPMAQLTELKA